MDPHPRGTVQQRAAMRVARGLGLAADRVTELSDGSEQVLALHPVGLVARICWTADDERRRAPARTQVALASYGARHGAPLVRPAERVDPGPHRVGDLLVTLWQLVTRADPIPAAAAGESLRRLHDRLAEYPGELATSDPRPLALEAAAALSSMAVPALSGVRASPSMAEIARVLRASAAACEPPDLPFQALHGDAHIGNVMGSPAGPLWIDLEDACRGPIEWDLACAAHRTTVSGAMAYETAAFLSGYGRDAAERAEVMADSVGLYLAARTALAVIARPALHAQLAERISWLRERLDS